jgi:hypothetical protein
MATHLAASRVVTSSIELELYVFLRMRKRMNYSSICSDREVLDSLEEVPLWHSRVFEVRSYPLRNLSRVMSRRSEQL